jgi:hypothetical protein
MAFDDGTPLDAAKLQALETELNNVKASIPKIGSSTVKIDALSKLKLLEVLLQKQDQSQLKDILMKLFH